MPDNAVDNIIRFLDYLKQQVGEAAQALTPTASHFYEVLVRQQFAIGISYAGWSIFHILMMFIYVLVVLQLISKAKLFTRVYFSNPNEGDSGWISSFRAMAREDRDVCYWLCMMLCATAVAFVFMNGITGNATAAFNDASEAVKRLINPEFYVLQEISDFLKAKK